MMFSRLSKAVATRSLLLQPSVRTLSSSNTPVTQLSGINAEQRKVLEKLSRDANYDPASATASRGTTEYENLVNERAAALKQLDKYSQSEKILSMITSRINSVKGLSEKKDAQNYLVTKLNNQIDSPMASLIASKLNDKDQRSVDDILHEAASKVEGAKRRIDNGPASQKTQFDRDHAFKPANVMEQFDRHDVPKVANYEQYRQHMLKTTREARQRDQAKKQVTDHVELVERNIEGIERMGPLGILDTSERVRESIAWTKGKRLGTIMGSKVDAQKIVDGTYASEYAQPVYDKFDQLMENDLYMFRNKLVQFMANPETLMTDFMPSVEQKTMQALREAILDTKEADRNEVQEMIIRRKYQFEEKLKEISEKQSGNLDPKQLSVVVRTALEKFQADMAILKEKKKDLNAFKTDNELLKEHFDVRKDVSEIESSVLQASEALKEFKDENYMKLEPGAFGSSQKTKQPYIDRVSLDLPRDKARELTEKTSDWLPNYSEKAKREIEEAKQFAIEGDRQDGKQQARDIVNQARTDENQKEIDTHLDQSYEQALRVEEFNASVRKLVSSKLLLAKNDLQRLTQARDSTYKEIMSDHERHVGSQLLPSQRLKDFLKMSKEQTQSQIEESVKSEISTALENNPKFDPSSKDPSHYENELRALSLLGTLKQDQELLDQYAFVISSMLDNNIQLNTELKSRAAEYAIMKNANQLTVNNFLADLTNNASHRTSSSQTINSHYLKDFFKKSLKADNLDGVAHLTNYCQVHNISVADFSLTSMRPALDYYMNKNFNLSKVMTFLKFFNQYYQDKAAAVIGDRETEMSQDELQAASTQLFSENDDLVDLDSLVDYLSKQAGDRQILDPLTKQDGLWNVIDNFTGDRDFMRASHLSHNTKLSGETLGRYCMNQVSGQNGFHRLFSMALRLEGTAQQADFHKQVLSSLRNHALVNKDKLPSSFNKQVLGNLYLKLRQNGVTLSPQLEELMLFSMDKLRMDAEVVDYCQKQTNKNDSHTYYLTEALLRMEFKDQTYQDVLDRSQMLKTDSPCEITQKTKAMFLDSGADVAITFFREKLHKRQDDTDARRKFLAGLYDETFASSSADTPLSMEDFEQKYFSSVNLTDKLLKEAYAVSKLKRVFENKDFEQMDVAFKLYSVLREERLLAGIEYMLDDSDAAMQEFARQLSENDRQKLSNIRERKLMLTAKLNHADYQSLKEIAQTMDSDKLEIFDGMDYNLVDRMLKMFESVATQESDLVIKSSSAVESVKNLIRDQMTGESGKTFGELMADIDELVDSLIPSDVGLMTQKGKLLKSKILASAFHQLDVDFGDNSGYIKKQKEMQEQMGVDLDVFKRFHYKSEHAYEEARYRILLQGVKKHMDVPMGNMRDKAVEYADERLEAHKRETFNYPKGSSGIISDKLRHNNIMLDGEKTLEQDPYMSPEENVAQQAESESNRDMLVNKLQEQYKDIKNQTSKKRSDQKKIQKAINKAESEQKSKKTGFMLGDLTGLDEVEKLNTDMKKVTAEYKQLKDLQTKKHAELNKAMEAGSSANDADADKIMQEYNQYFLEEVTRTLDARRQQKDELNKMSPKDFQAYVDKKVRKFEAEDDEEYVSEEEQEIMERLESKQLKDDDIDKYIELKMSDMKFDDIKQFDDKKNKLLQEEIKIIQEDRHTKLRAIAKRRAYIGKKDARDQLKYSPEEVKRRDNLRAMEIEQSSGLRASMIRDEAMHELDAKYPNKMTHSELHRDEDMNWNDPANNYQNEFKEMFEFDSLEKMSRLRRRRMKFENDSTTDTDSEEQGLYERQKKEWSDYMKTFDGPQPGDGADPYNTRKKAHDNSLADLKTEMLEALDKRKQAVLPTAIQIFNKLQEKYVKPVDLDDYDAKIESVDEVTGFAQKAEEIKDINQSLNKLELLIEDGSSPILSAIKSSDKYELNKLPSTRVEYNQRHEQPVDVVEMVRDAHKLGQINEELDNIAAFTEEVENQIQSGLEQLKRHTQSEAYLQSVKEREAAAESLRKESLKQAYDQYLAKRQNNPNDDPANISMDTKVDLMRQLLSIEMGEDFVNSADCGSETTFPAFYALDLIQFGIQRDIPGAIRLGEILLAENCASDPDAKIPQELAAAVRNYLFENNERYRSAIQQTGPINNTSMYHKARMESGDDSEGVPMLFCRDDPYYKDLVNRNYRREDMYLTPSKLAWDHKPYGMLGEIFNIDALKQRVAQQKD